MSTRPILCRICRCPALDTGVRMSDFAVQKLATWWKKLLKTELQEENLWDDFVCQFCIIDAKFEGEEKGRKRCDWWTGYDTNKIYLKHYYKDAAIKPCEVKVIQLKLPSEASITLDDAPNTPNSFRSVWNQIKTNCDFCGIIFPSKKKAMQHIFKQHQSEKKFKCDLCSIFFKTKDSQQEHLDEIHGGCFQCFYCPKKCKDYSCLNHHIRDAHSNVVVKCQYCRRLLPNQKARDAHCDEKHPKIKFECCVYCKKSISCTELTRHVSRCHKEVALKCPYKMCTRFFLTVAEREQHKVGVHESHPGRHRCIFCQLTLVNSNSLANHLQMVHPSETYFKCKFKHTRYFQSKEQLQHHIANDHKVEVKTKCVYCQRSFESSKLLKHMYWFHRKEKIKCEYPMCRKYFISRADLDRHLHEKHQKEEEAKTNLCSQCPYKTSDKKSLSNHIMAKHGTENIKCPECPKYFKSQFALRVHFRSHRSKGFCYHCKAYKNNLKIHLRGDYCVTCEKRVCKATNIEKHKKICKKIT